MRRVAKPVAKRPARECESPQLADPNQRKLVRGTPDKIFFYKQNESGTMTTNNLFQLNLPDGWKETTIYTFQGPHDSGVQHNLVLVIDPEVPKKTDLREYARKQSGTTKEALPGFALISETEKTMPGGVAAFEIVFKYAPAQGVELFQKQVFMIVEGKGYIFSATFSKKTLQTIAYEVDEIIKTLMVNKKE
jgi:hypothetical protein